MSINYFQNLQFVALQKLDDSSLKNRLVKLKTKNAKVEKLKQACNDFEAIFLQKMWEQMRKTVPKEGYLHSKEEDMYLSLFDQELGKVLAKSGGIGLANLMFEQLKEKLDQQEDKVENKVHIKQGDNSLSSLDNKIERLAKKIELKHQPGKGGIPRLGGIKKISFLDLKEDNFIWPVNGRISSGFGWRLDPFTATRAWHSGVDIAVPIGTEVRACMSGKVVFAGEKSGYGNLVIIKHKNGIASYYAHNSKLLVEKGQFVRFGQKIALSGDSGRSTGPHLHFELRNGDIALNPLKFKTFLLAKKE
ncbi:Rod binding protein [Desulfonauticus submarinus]|uniref:Rod binding protein n=1 Tax=Desulfonauticus submarinus TaxID=206665 RepID=A0A1H0AJP0_9BACT|nr:peptidoglycan DD-metalloendopeptidase family protein [Desulfonauticus submarinus]SDN33770.1 Rod binding protein [Desulfonauticus submarinus]